MVSKFPGQDVAVRSYQMADAVLVFDLGSLSSLSCTVCISKRVFPCVWELWTNRHQEGR